MASKIDIVNSGLIKIGAEPIMALTDDTKTAKLATLRFDMSRRAVLRAHIWNCATKRVILSPLTTTPPFGFTNEFQMPSDLLRVVRLNDQTSHFDLDFKIEGRKIRADETTLELKYIFDETDTSQYDALLDEALGAYIAWDLSYAILQSSAARDDAWKWFQNIIKQARFVDSSEDPSEEFDVDVWLESRLRFGERPLRGDR